LLMSPLPMLRRWPRNKRAYNSGFCAPQSMHHFRLEHHWSR
jgi:hypothetical protein